MRLHSGLAQCVPSLMLHPCRQAVYLSAGKQGPAKEKRDGANKIWMRHISEEGPRAASLGVPGIGVLYRAEPTAEQGVPHCWKTPFRYTTGTQEGLSTPCWGRPHCIAPEADTASWAGPSHGMSHGLCQHPVPGPKTWLQPQPGSKEKAAAHQKALQGAQWGMAELEVPWCWRGAGSTPLPCHPCASCHPCTAFLEGSTAFCWHHKHRTVFNEGSALAPGQLVSFTSPFILKRNLCPYYLTSSSVAANYIKAHFPKLRNFRIYFVACRYGESLLRIRACRGHERGQPGRQHHTRLPPDRDTSADTGGPVPEHLPKEGHGSCHRCRLRSISA